MCNPNKPTKSIVKPPLGCDLTTKTVFEKPMVNLDLNDLDSADVAALKKKDPFMYYSISEVMDFGNPPRRVEHGKV